MAWYSSWTQTISSGLSLATASTGWEVTTLAITAVAVAVAVSAVAAYYYIHKKKTLSEIVDNGRSTQMDRETDSDYLVQIESSPSRIRASLPVSFPTHSIKIEEAIPFEKIPEKHPAPEEKYEEEKLEKVTITGNGEDCAFHAIADFLAAEMNLLTNTDDFLRNPMMVTFLKCFNQHYPPHDVSPERFMLLFQEGHEFAHPYLRQLILAPAIKAFIAKDAANGQKRGLEIFVAAAEKFGFGYQLYQTGEEHNHGKIIPQTVSHLGLDDKEYNLACPAKGKLPTLNIYHNDTHGLSAHYDRMASRVSAHDQKGYAEMHRNTAGLQKAFLSAGYLAKKEASLDDLPEDLKNTLTREELARLEEVGCMLNPEKVHSVLSEHISVRHGFM